MQITEVKIFPVVTSESEKLKAYATIVLGGCFVIRDLKVINSGSGLFVAMPSKKRKDGSFKDIAHPVNQSTRMQVEKVVLDAYLAELQSPGSTSSRSGSSDTDSENHDEVVRAS